MDEPDYREYRFSALESLLNSGGYLQELKIIESGTFEENEFGYLELARFKFEKDIFFRGVEFSEEVEFNDCIFEGNVKFENTEFRTKFTFRNCIFKKSLKFHSCSFNNFQLFGGQYQNVFFTGIHEELDGENAIHLDKGKFENLEFKDAEIKCTLKLTGTVLNDIFFIKSRIKKDVSLSEDVTISNLSAQSSDFHDRIDFSNGLISGVAYFHKSSFYEQVIFRESFKIRSLTLANVYSKHDVSIAYKDNIESLNVSDCKFDSTLSCYCHQESKSGLMEMMTCDLGGLLNGNIVFENVPLSPLTISAINFGNLIFNYVRTSLVIIKDFHNHGKLTMSSLVMNKGYNVFVIFDSNIDTTEFINIDFRKFNEVVVAKSNVSNFLLSNSIFPNEIQIKTKEPRLGYEIKPDEMIDENMYFRESYRQLKMAMERQGNRNASMIYKSKEMHYLRKELGLEWDKVLLHLNFLSNNHGISWTVGVLFTILSAFFFFILYHSTINEPLFTWSLDCSVEQIKDAFFIGLDGFLKYLASFPKLRFENDANSWQTNLIVLLSRIFIGYGIYQTISAFRKYGK